MINTPTVPNCKCTYMYTHVHICINMYIYVSTCTYMYMLIVTGWGAGESSEIRKESFHGCVNFRKVRKQHMCIVRRCIRGIKIQIFLQTIYEVICCTVLFIQIFFKIFPCLENLEVSYYKYMHTHTHTQTHTHTHSCINNNSVL